MPIRLKIDRRGHYYQWGKRGTKYYFSPYNFTSEKVAYHLALRQAEAAYANGYREK
jgi:hypothetical protein